MHDWLLATWYGGGRRGWWLQPFAWLYAAAAAVRRQAYRAGVLRSYRSPALIVVVGNLSVGGTGKTPFVIWLATELSARGLRIGVASRGYGGAGGPARHVTEADTAADVGDEAILLRRRLRVPVAIGSRRVEAVRLLEPDCELILCDDGLQHYALQRDFEIAIVDGARGLGNGRLLPAGPLRESRTRLHAVDTVVVHGDGFDWPGSLRMRLVPTVAMALASGERRSLASFAGCNVDAIAAVGNPQRFFTMLREHGLQVDEHPLPDHAIIAPESFRSAVAKPVLMTEKDAVKCKVRPVGAWYVEVAAGIERQAAAGLLDGITRLGRRVRAGD